MTANERRRTHTHERTHMGTGADVYGRTKTYIDGRGRIMGFKRTDVHVLEQMHRGARWTYGRTGKKSTRCKKQEKQALRGLLNSN